MMMPCQLILERRGEGVLTASRIFFVFFFIVFFFFVFLDNADIGNRLKRNWTNELQEEVELEHRIVVQHTQIGERNIQHSQGEVRESG